MRIKTTDAADFTRLDPQDEQAHDLVQYTLEYGRKVLAACEAATILSNDGVVVAIVGVVVVHPGRALVWTMLARDAGRHMLGLTKTVKKLLQGFCNYDRVEATVRADFSPGHRWARLFGFERECTMRRFGPDGQDYDLYARVKA